MKIVDSRTDSLRQRRRALNPYNDKKEPCSYELGGYSIAACVIFLFFIGFSATASYMTTACSKEFNSGLEVSKKGSSLRSSSTSSSAKVAEPAAAAPKTAPVPQTPPPPPPPETKLDQSGFPPACTDEQSAASLKQLPADGCHLKPWTQSCSTTKATTKSCRDSYWMREFYATTKLNGKFNAFVVPYAPTQEQFSDTPIDLLHIGTHKTKYAAQKTKWVELAGLPSSTSCQRPVEVGNDEQDAKVVLVLGGGQSEDAINHYKENLEISNENLEVVPDDARIDDAFLTSKLPTAESQIHYLKYLTMSPDRYQTSLKQMTRITSVWYLEMTLDWKAGMTNGHIEELLTKFLPEKGFVCYWAGNDNLWRITNCWQNHYATSTWSNLACVNARIPEAKPLLDKMEKIFVETLAKDITF
mmetsp:Transcript_403/g.586  ORF Transcript_403/g.586 Transcript_403/m.586 type:complete len:414 (+) Transcript_403:160-1401(+)